jgi:hypothetical protein
MSSSAFQVQLYSGSSGFSGAGGGLSPSNIFISSEITANGSEQSTSHGFGSTPIIAWAICVEGHDNAGGAGTLHPVIGTGPHDSTNCKFTLTAGAKYRVYAIK